MGFDSGRELRLLMCASRLRSYSITELQNYIRSCQQEGAKMDSNYTSEEILVRNLHRYKARLLLESGSQVVSAIEHFLWQIDSRIQSSWNKARQKKP